ncbi:hypothetical protein RJZ90_002840 [Blastomyces dermatitidis]
MTSLSFTLLPDALLQLHDVLICLAKFNENVSIEAEESFLRFSALNLTKSAYASFKFDASTFFSQYMFVGSGRIASGSGRRSAADKLTCQLYIKTYKLTYEAAEIQHALFDKSKTENQWGIDSKYLREIIDHFGHTAEQLDISSENNRVVFTSFTTKVADGKEILKQPVHTSVAIDIKDFDHFTVEDKLHVAINVKDFKAIVVHAHSLSARVVARYTRPCRPMQVSYEVGGMTCEFTLMTRGESGETSPGSGNRNRELSARPYPRSTTAHSREPTAIPPPEIPESVPRAHPLQPPSQAAAREETQTSVLPHPPHASVPFESLFVPVDDDQQWDEPKYGDEEEDTLGWDTHMDQDALQASIGGRIQDITPTGASMRQRSAQDQESSVAIPPTQRISQNRYEGYSIDIAGEVV